MLKRILSFVLILGILLGSGPQAGAIDLREWPVVNNTETIKEDSPLEAETEAPVEAEPPLRQAHSSDLPAMDDGGEAVDAHTKKYALNDGYYEAAVTFIATAYETANGRILPIDNSLIPIINTSPATVPDTPETDTVNDGAEAGTPEAAAPEDHTEETDTVPSLDTGGETGDPQQPAPQQNENTTPEIPEATEETPEIMGYHNAANRYDLRVLESGGLFTVAQDGLAFSFTGDGDVTKASVDGNALRLNDYEGNIDLQLSAHNDYVRLDWILLDESAMEIPALSIEGNAAFEERDGYLYAAYGKAQFLIVPVSTKDLRGEIGIPGFSYAGGSLSLESGLFAQEGLVYPVTVSCMLIPIGEKQVLRLAEDGRAALSVNIPAETGYEVMSAALDMPVANAPESITAVVSTAAEPVAEAPILPELFSRTNPFLFLEEQPKEAVTSTPPSPTVEEDTGTIPAGEYEIPGEDTYLGKTYDVSEAVNASLSGKETSLLLDLDIQTFAEALDSSSRLRVLFAAAAAPAEVDFKVESEPTTIKPYGQISIGGGERNHVVYYTLTPDGEEKSAGAAGGSWEGEDEIVDAGTPGPLYQITAYVKYQQRIGDASGDEIWVDRQRSLPPSDTFIVFTTRRGDFLHLLKTFYGGEIRGDDNPHIDPFTDTRMLPPGTDVLIRNPGSTGCPEELCDGMIELLEELIKHGMEDFITSLSYDELIAASHFIGDPINARTGGYTYFEEDASIATYGEPFSITRSYESGGGTVVGAFGRGWNSPLSARLMMGDTANEYYGLLYRASVKIDLDAGTTATGSDGHLYRLADATSAEIKLYDLTTGETYVFLDSGKLSVYEDRKGNRTVYTYSGMELTGITLDTGVTLSVTSDAIYGIIKSISLPNGATLAYTYDDKLRLTSVKDANGNTIRYDYDDSGNMTKWTDQNGVLSVTNAFDAQGRVTWQEDANGNVYTANYADGVYTFYDWDGAATEMEAKATTRHMDENRNPTHIIYPDGTEELRTYDAAGRMLSYTNREGHTATYGYDANGNITSITRADGATRTFTYDGMNLVTSDTDYAGNTTRYEYDDKGNLVKETNAMGVSKTYTYNAKSQLVEETDYNGNTSRYAYTGANMTSYWNGNGNLYQYTYDSMGNLTGILDPIGGNYTFTYNNRSQLATVTNPDGGVIRYGYDKNGNLVSQTDGNNNVTILEYDGMDSLSAMTDPKSYTTSFEKNSAFVVETLKDAAGYEYDMALDAVGRITAVTDPLNNVVSREYDREGNLTAETDAKGNAVKVEYDILSRPVTVTDRLGNETLYEYDAVGNITKTTYPDASTELFVYDALYRVTAYTDQTGLTTAFTYDNNGNVLKTEDSANRIYSYTYDKNNNLLTQTDPLNYTAAFTYDGANNPKEYTDGNGHTSLYGYDNMARLLSAADAEGNTVSYTYDYNGNVKTYTDAEGNATTYTYDGLDNVETVTDALGGKTVYAYDALSNVTSVTGANGGVTAYEYDALSRPVKVTDAEGGTYLLSYDENGNVVSMTDPNGNETLFGYDEEDRLVKSTDALGLIEETLYDAMGRNTRVWDNAGNEMAYMYAPGGQLLTQTNALNQSASFTYDAASRITAATGFDGKTWQYEYDGLDQLTGATDPLSRQYAFTYDGVGNVISQTIAGHAYGYTYDKANRLVEDLDPLNGKQGYAYDGNGRLTGYTDQNGEATLYEYDELNRHVKTTDPRGSSEAYTYDAVGNMLRFTDREGNSTNYAYDLLSRLTTWTDANGGVESYTYDKNGNVLSMTDAVGAITTSTYSAHNLPLVVTDALGGETIYTYSLNGQLTGATDALGAKTAYTYDVLQRLTSMTTPKGYEIRLAYSAAGDVSRQTDSLGRTTTFEYDAMHRMTAAVDAMRGVTRYTYDELDNLTGVRTPMGRKYSYEYDPLSRLTAELDPLGAKTSYTYDPAGNVLEVHMPENRTYSYGYDENGNVTAVTDALGNTGTFSYDKNDRQLNITTAEGAQATATYDAVGNIVKETDIHGSVTAYTYTPRNYVETMKDPMGNITSYSYDLLGRLTSVTDADTGTTAYAYDAVGNLTSVTDANGGVTGYAYDLEGNVTSITDALSQTEGYQYDLAGRLKSYTKKDGNTLAYSYDELDRLVEIYEETSARDETLSRYAYDADGYLVQSVNENGALKYDLDAAGRPTKIQQPDGSILTYGYDSAGRITSITYPEGTKVTYTYDAGDRLVGVKSSLGDVTAYTYDGDGKVLTETTNGSVTTYTYNGDNRLERKETKDKGKLIASYAYEYDQSGNITKEDATQDGSSWVRTYTYDALDRLVSSATTGTFNGGNVDENTSYEYDGNGNRTAEIVDGVRAEYTYNAINQLVAKGDISYTYDKNGNRTLEETGTSGWVRYVYDDFDRLIAVYSSGARTKNNILRRYGYDAEDNRLYEQRYFLAETQYTDRYYLGGGFVVEEADTYERVLKSSGGYYRTLVEEDAFYEEPITPIELGPDPDAEYTEVTTYEEQTKPGTEEQTGEAPSFFWYGFTQGLNRTLLFQPLSELLARLWNILWRFIQSLFTPAETVLVPVTTLVPVEKEEELPVVELEEEDPITPEELREWVPSVFRTETVTDEEIAVGEEEVYTEYSSGEVTAYELVWYINDVNREHTEVVMTKGVNTGYTRRYTYGNERLTWDYIGSGGGYTRSNAVSGQYVHDGRGSASMMLERTSLTVQMSHYYTAYGDVTSVLSISSTATTRAPWTGMWDAYRYNAEDYDGATGLSYLRARYLDIDTASFMTADTYLGNIIQPLSLNLYVYVQGNPVRWRDPSGHNKNILTDAAAITVVGYKQNEYVQEYDPHAPMMTVHVDWDDATDAQKIAGRYADIASKNPGQSGGLIKLSSAHCLVRAQCDSKTPCEHLDDLCFGWYLVEGVGRVYNLDWAIQDYERLIDTIKDKYIYVPDASAPGGYRKVHWLDATDEQRMGALIDEQGWREGNESLTDEQIYWMKMSPMMDGAATTANTKYLDVLYWYPTEEAKDAFYTGRGWVGLVANTVLGASLVAATHADLKADAQNNAVCFVAGTLIFTTVGHVPIEDICLGDQVYAENPETGEKGTKTVVRTFVNETDELVHIQVEGEAIITTPEHPFYVPQKGWVPAIQLRAGDMLLLQSGEYIVVEAVAHELLEAPVAVYNLEVEDLHTYYVGSNGVLVHNSCNPTKGKPDVPEGSTRVRIDSRNVNSQQFKDYIRSQGSTFRSSEWKYKMETWETPSGTYVERHYWHNSVTGESYYHD